MYYLTDIKGEQLPVENIAASLKEVNAFLNDVELVIAMHTDELKYWKDIQNQLLQLQGEINQ